MNKSINILYKVILILIVTQLILSEEQNSSPDIVGTGSFGAATINGKIYNQISFRPEIRYKKLGVGLDINFYIDENGDIYEGNWLLDDSNSIFQTVMDKIYYVRWGNKYDNFYFRVGALESVTLGYGSLVDRYSNAIEYPQIKKLGMDLIYGTDKFKFEFVHSNFKMNPALVGANLKYNMSPRINLLISVAHDSNQLTRLDEIYASRNKESWTETCEETLNVYNPVFTDNEFDEEAHSSTCNEYYDDLESETSYDDENGIPRVDDITGISIGADYVLSERMAFYTEWAHLIGKINAIGTDNQLKEESLGHGIIFPGFIYRFKNGVFQIEARHTLAQNFVFNYWDRSYDIERATQSDDPINPGLGFSTKKQRLYNYGKMHGLYAFVSYDILKIMNFGLGYQDM